MSNTNPLEMGTESSLKGKEFDEACHLVGDDDNAKVFVHQKPDGSGRWDFCFSFSPGEYDEATLLEQLVMDYGPGEYPVQIRSQSDSGQPRIRWQKNMRVVARRRPLSEVSVQPVPAAPSTDALAMAIENQSRLLAAVLEKVSQPAPAPEQKNVVDLAKELEVFKNLFSDNKQSPFEAWKDMLEMQKLMVEAAGGDADPLSKALNMFGPKIVEGIDDARAREQRTRPAAAQAQPNPQLPQATPAADVQPKFAHIDTEAAYAIFAENYLSKMLALPGKPSPEDLGKYIARLVGDNEQLLHVVGLVIEKDDMAERLAPFDERVMERAEWLNSIADWLAHALWPDTNDAPTPENATFNATFDEKTDSRGINDADSDDSTASREGKTDAQIVDEPGEPGTSTPPGQLDNDA